MCKHFKAVATHPIFTRTVEPGKTIMEVVKQARAGDTLVIPPGLYDVSSPSSLLVTTNKGPNAVHMWQKLVP